MIENNRDMKIKKLIKYYLLGESLKEIEMNRILDKIGSSKKLSEKEINFLNLYQHTREELMKDFMYLSKNSTYSKIEDLLKNKKTIICNLHDKDGKFGLKIVSIENVFEEDICTVIMKGDERHNLQDKFLYNIIYNTKKDEYSLEEQDEYFEKIEASNGDDD
jgi:hypothetical protein